MLKRRPAITLIILFLLECIGTAQVPDWINYVIRSKSYPESQYLSSFSSEKVPKGQNATDIIDKLANNVRLSIVQSMKVTINITSTMELANINTKSDEAFRMKSTTVSAADITGLKVETFYHEKEKTAYAFAYAKRSDLIGYYTNLISNKLESLEQKINEAGQFLANSNIQYSARSYYECFPLFFEIEEAQSLLIVLGEKGDGALQVSRLNEDKMKVKKTLSEVLVAISSIEVKPVSPVKNLKLTQTQIPLEVRTVFTVKGSGDKSQVNIPVRFQFSNSDTVFNSSISNNEGISSCFIEKLPANEKILIIKAEIDIVKYIDLNQDIKYYSEIVRSFPAGNSAVFTLNISGPKVFVESTEIQFGNKTSMTVIEPKLKEFFSNYGFVFTDKTSDADFSVTISSTSRKGQELYGIFSSFVNVNVSVKDMLKKEEIYKNSLQDIKGLAVDFDQASGRAFSEAADKIIEDLKPVIEKIL
jgi:hypothetical protein